MVRLLLTWLLALAAPLAAQDRDIDFYGFAEVTSELSDEENKVILRRLVLINSITAGPVRTFVQGEAEPDEDEVEIDLGWVEYLYSDQLKVRAGRFLAPFGIYNLIHDATPTFPTASLPLLYEDHAPFGGEDNQLYAKSYDGVQIAGSYQPNLSTRLSYSADLGEGEGRSRVANFRLKTAHADGWQLGLTYQLSRNKTGFSGKEDASEQLYGLDLDIDRDRWLLQAEYALFRLEQLTSGFHSAHIGYGLLGYRLGAATPVVRYDYVDAAKGGDAFGQVLLGVNVEADEHLTVKSEFQFRSGDDSDWLHLTSINWAF